MNFYHPRLMLAQVELEGTFSDIEKQFGSRIPTLDPIKVKAGH